MDIVCGLLAVVWSKSSGQETKGQDSCKFRFWREMTHDMICIVMERALMKSTRPSQPFPCFLLPPYTIQKDTEPYTIALWGDLPYRGTTARVFDDNDDANDPYPYGTIYTQLRDSINAYPHAFTIHAGDILWGGTGTLWQCNDTSYTRFQDLMNSLHCPGILTLGDSKCDRIAACRCVFQQQASVCRLVSFCMLLHSPHRRYTSNLLCL